MNANRRGPWRVLCAAAALMLGSADVLADQTYLREADAPRAMFPAATEVERGALDLTEAEVKTVSQTLARRVDSTHYPYINVRKNGTLLGTIFVLDVVGQSRPITFAVAVTPDGAVSDMEVMVYREPQGEQIQEARFRRQFNGKRLKDPIALGRDVDAISGATISSRAATYAVRKGLALSETLRARRAP
jgi:Na+-translocating ferredoxin:NAD+ oxidoreductase RnfG subunit